MNDFKEKVEQFSKYSLYSPNLTNQQKTELYRDLRQTIPDGVSGNEKDYILSQLMDVGEINQYTIPVVKELVERFLLRYNTYYGINEDSDVLVTDLDHKKLLLATNRSFKKVYHGEVTAEELVNSSNKTKGVVWKGVNYGVQNRVLFCFPLKRNSVSTKPAIWCTFILDTGSKLNYISDETMEKLGIEIAGRGSEMSVVINGINTFAYPSNLDFPRLEGVNLLGYEFLKSFDCDFVFTSRNGECIPSIIPFISE
jgi:hypothetical protein